CLSLPVLHKVAHDLIKPERLARLRAEKRPKRFAAPPTLPDHSLSREAIRHLARHFTPCRCCCFANTRFQKPRDTFRDLLLRSGRTQSGAAAKRDKFFLQPVVGTELRRGCLFCKG